MDFFEWLVSFFDISDPIDLIYRDENLRQYKTEAQMLLAYLPHAKSADDVAQTLRAIFAYQFSSDIIQNVDFKPHAAIIYHRWLRAAPYSGECRGCGMPECYAVEDECDSPEDSGGEARCE